MALNAAEKRSQLEKKLEKLASPKAAETVDEKKAKIQAEIDKLSTHKDMEGKLALWDVEGNGKVKVRVMINGFTRKAFGRDLFSVSPMEGEGAVSVSVDRLAIEKDADTTTDPPTA